MRGEYDSSRVVADRRLPYSPGCICGLHASGIVGSARRGSHGEKAMRCDCLASKELLCSKVTIRPGS